MATKGGWTSVYARIAILCLAWVAACSVTDSAPPSPSTGVEQRAGTGASGVLDLGELAARARHSFRAAHNSFEAAGAQRSRDTLSID